MTDHYIFDITEIPQLVYAGPIKECDKQPGALKPRPGSEAKENDIIKMKWRR